MDAGDCLPPQCELVIEAPAEADGPAPHEALDGVLEPVGTVMETITATTGWGLPLDYDEAAYAALPHRREPVPELMGLEVAYVVAGDPLGRRVIFVHGAPGEASEWGRYLLGAPPGFEYLALDRPGYGDSGPAEGDLAQLEDQARALGGLLESRDGKLPILVGYSYGGPVVAAAAVLYQPAVGGVVIVGGALDPELEDPSLLQYVAELSPIAELLPRDLDSANGELLELRDGIRRLQPRLADLAMPVTLLHGTADTLVPVENVAYLQRHLERVEALRVVLVDGADHFLPWSHYDLLQEELRALAAELDAQGR